MIVSRRTIGSTPLDARMSPIALAFQNQQGAVEPQGDGTGAMAWINDHRGTVVLGVVAVLAGLFIIKRVL